LASTLLANELDVAHVASPWVLQANALDRSSRIGGGDWSKIKPLFPDRMAEGKRFFQKHGFLPVNHAYIIRGDIYKKYPWVAFNLYSGFVKAKNLAREKLLERIPSALFFGPEYVAMTRQMIGDDPFPYGVKANRALLDTLVSFSHEQGLTPHRMAIDELFAQSTVDL
jgi:4,5-dihydroxyphthalate decarboxylase